MFHKIEVITAVVMKIRSVVLCDTVMNGKWLHGLRRSTLYLSLVTKTSFLPEDRGRKLLRNVRKYCKSIRCYVPEDFNLQFSF